MEKEVLGLVVALDVRTYDDCHFNNLTMVTEIVSALTVNKSKTWVCAPTMSGEKGVCHGDNHK